MIRESTLKTFGLNSVIEFVLVKIDQKNIEHYWELAEVISITPFGNGHINDTYRVETTSGEFILQRVNKNVFRTKELVENYQVLVDSVNRFQKETGNKITPQIFKTKQGAYHKVDEDGFAWRLVEFIADADSYDICPHPSIAYKAAKAIGRYQLFLNTLDLKLFKDTIVGFHNLPSRIMAFRDALKNAENELLKSAKEEVDKSLEMEFIVEETSSALAGLPVRLNHNDTKLNNAIFSGEEVLVIDLDTVMQGNTMFDFGDMVRTFTSPALEDEQDISKVKFRIEYFEALTKGYLEPLRTNLTRNEKESLFLGALYIIYEQALRFLTDYLNGNIYYKVNYEEHNLVRTRTQLKLLSDMLEQREQLQKIIKENS